MIDKVIRWSLENRVLVLGAAVVLLVLGGLQVRRLPIDVFPDLTAPTVTVLAEFHGMAPEEVESQITFPIETAVSSVPGVRRVRSSSSVGISIVWVELDWGADVYAARQMVSEKLQIVRAALPEEVEGPVLAPVSSIMGEILFLALVSDRHDLVALKDASDRLVRRRLLAVPGVAQVVPTGGETKQYQVQLRPERLATYGIGLDEVLRALGSSNENVSAGLVVDGGRQLLVQGIGRVGSTEDIAQTVVAVRGGEPVLVRNLGDVRIGAAPPLGRGAFQGRPAVVLGVQRQPEANTIALTKRIDAAVGAIQEELPEGMRLEPRVFRQADFIEIAVENVLTALRDGALLVIVIVFLFLASVRATSITVLAIPLSLVAAVFALRALDASIDTMTLGGMAIAVGALVDDAIVDVENVVRRLRQNETLVGDAKRPALEVVYDASREVRGSIVVATVVIALVFVPLFFLSGVEGRLLRPLGLAYVVSLGASLLVALTVTPALGLVLLPRSKDVRRSAGRLVRWLERGYEPVIRATVGRWKTVAAASLAALAVAAGALAFAGTAFLPDFNEGSLVVSIVTLPGTSLQESDRIGRMAEALLRESSEVVSTGRRTGRAELEEHSQDPSASEIEVALRPTDRSKEEVLTEIRENLSLLPGANVTIGQPISHRIDHMLSGTRASVAVKVFGDDLAELRRLADEIRRVMAGVAGVVDLSLEQQPDIPLVTVRLRRDVIARHALGVRDVMEALEVAFSGHGVSRVLEGQIAYDLVVRLGEGGPRDVEQLRALRVTTPGGAQVPLHALAEVREDLGPSSVSRENVQRKVVIMCNVSGRDLGSVVDEIAARIDDRVPLPDGYRVDYGGQFESARQARQTLLFVGLAVFAAIVILLVVALGSVRDAALVLVNLPLAAVGGVAGVFLSGGVLSVASLIGFITLFGIATRNGLMLVSHVHHLVRIEGVRDPVEAVSRGARERLSPILMTALAAGLALVPLALAGGEPGSEIQSPMAVVILCGLLTSTALNMIILPALYARFGSVVRQERG